MWKYKIFFKTKDGEVGKSRIPSKRKQDELAPTILVEQTSTSTLVGEEDNETTHRSQQLQWTDKNKEKVALKLNQLKDKAVRYNKLHEDFLGQCIAEELFPKGPKLELEHTIGNYDQEFIDTWYLKLKTFSLTLMKEIVAHCDKTIVKTTKIISKIQTHIWKI